METLHEFTERIRSFQIDSVPDEPVFGLPSSLAEKVAPGSGTLLPFYGDTIAYFLDEQVRAFVGEIADSLHARFRDSLSQPLPVEMAHVTLHDLHASPDLAQVQALMEGSASRAVELVAEARRIGSIETRCTAVFNLVNTSIVIGITPINEGEHRKLLTARALFDEIVPSGPFTPHITLAYYRSAPPALISPEELGQALRELTERVAGKHVILNPERLYALHFDSMANYWPIQE